MSPPIRRAPTPQNAKFQVIDLGKGRVALKAANGRFVSAADRGGCPERPRRKAAPGDAESFQWVNLMRGDTMLMSLTNHRYLATKPERAWTGHGFRHRPAPGPQGRRLFQMEGGRMRCRPHHP